MDHEKYLKRLNQLADELQAAGNARSYDPDEYNRVVDELNALRPGTTESSTRPARPKQKPPWSAQIFAAARCLKKILKKAVLL